MNRWLATLLKPSASVATGRRGGAVASLWQPQVWLYLPIYIALFIALGAACRALAHFITNSDVTIYLWATLLINCVISFGVQCGNAHISRACHRIRLLLFLLLPFGAILFNTAVLAPLDAEAEINATVSLVVGWTSLLCVLLIGSHYGDRRLPFAAPLVPALSLFGLLNSLSVDTIIQICFLIFVAASLYLIVYEPMLHRLNARYCEETQKPALATRALLLPERRRSQRARLPGFLSRPEISRNAVGYLAACSVWFAAFLGGAALFYYPVEAILPRVMAAPLGAVRGASAALLDWRGASPVMELRGGNYPLSDRAVLQVEMRQPNRNMSSTPVLWRGRIFEQYETSRWVEVQSSRNSKTSFKVKRGIQTRVPRQISTPTGNPILDIAKNPHALLSPRLVRRYEIEAFVQPERGAPQSIFFPGELQSIQTSLPTVRLKSNGTFSTGSSWQTSQPYALSAIIKEERLSGLMRAPGLNQTALQAWRQDAELSPTLQISPELRRQLAPIVAQIEANLERRHGSGAKLPFAKANAIRDYLVNTCTYSLSSPLVPATEDAVVFFMTKSKRGACDMFASSMALLLRAMNVPARLATGYIEPEELTDGRVTTGGSTLASNALDEIFKSQSTSKSSTNYSRNDNAISFSMRERDAHAWVEYFIPGAGWLTYDPTAGTRTTQMPIEDQLVSMLSLPSLKLNWSTLSLPLCGLLLVCTGLAWSFYDLHHRPVQTPQTPSDVTRAHITAAYRQGVELLSRLVPPAPHLTPREYETAINRADIPHQAKQEFSALTYLLIAARYTDSPPAMSQQELNACLVRLRRALRHKS